MIHFFQKTANETKPHSYLQLNETEIGLNQLHKKDGKG